MRSFMPNFQRVNIWRDKEADQSEKTEWPMVALMKVVYVARGADFGALEGFLGAAAGGTYAAVCPVSRT